LYESKCEYDRALPLYEEALKMRRGGAATGPPPHRQLAQQPCRLVQRQGRVRLGAAAVRGGAGDDAGGAVSGATPTPPRSLSNLAALYEAKGEYERALPLHEQALEMMREALPLGHPEIATSLSNLAFLY
jgi:tetratricopeptide (TPR) repeat protein